MIEIKFKKQKQKKRDFQISKQHFYIGTNVEYGLDDRNIMLYETTN